MKFIFSVLFLQIFFIAIKLAEAVNNAMDVNLYEEVLDPAACENQLAYILSNDTLLRAQFMDASMRTPRGLLMANLRDMGSYYQCLDINQEIPNMMVEGKYCVIQIPLKQESDIPSIGPEFPWAEQSWSDFYGMKSRSINKDTFYDMIQYEQGKRSLKNVLGNRNRNPREVQESPLGEVQFELAICIPKVCTTQQALSIITMNMTSNFEIREAFCRLPNDKPWVAADYVAISIFSVIGLVTILSTFYDVRHSFLLQGDPKQASKLYTAFSVYTNTRKLFTFQNNPNALSCLEGIRSIAMLWVIIGHTFATQVSFIPANPLAIFDFMTSFTSLWITSATIAVDTFFMMSGLLVVYTTASKMSRMGLVRNLHLFYLNRILRMFPVLATGVLLQASLLNHMTDGPYWGVVAKSVNDCRQNWWSTLLYVHNFVSYGYLCVGHSWYLAIDMQLYIISPIVLFWVLGGNKRSAWTALIGSLLAVLAGSTVFNFIMEFQSAAISLTRPEESDYFTKNYYINTLTRSAPFFVGMLFGYILHLYRGRKVRISKVLVTMLWLLAVVATTIVIVSHHFIIQVDWDNQTMDSIVNSFMRPVWAAGVAWLVFACTHGYAGPINWFLSLHVFKILGRLSYAMYILHLPLMYLTNATALSPIYFTVGFLIRKFMVDLNFTIIASLLVTVVIDLPFSRLIGMFISGSKTMNKNEKMDNNNVNVEIKGS